MPFRPAIDDATTQKRATTAIDDNKDATYTTSAPQPPATNAVSELLPTLSMSQMHTTTDGLEVCHTSPIENTSPANSIAASGLSKPFCSTTLHDGAAL